MAGEDPDYLRWLRHRRCAAAGLGDECWGFIAPHHRRGVMYVGMGQRDHDHTAIPLCVRHHEAFHQNRPPFRDMSLGKAAWTEAMIAYHRKLYLTPPPDWA